MSAADEEEVFHHSLSVYLNGAPGSVVNPSCVWTDVPVCLAICGVLLAVRYLTCGASRTSKRKCWVHSLTEGRGIVRDNKMGKFCENLWYGSWHTASLAFGLYVLFACEAGPNFSGWFGQHLLSPSGRWYWLATSSEHAGGTTLGWPLLPLGPVTKFYYLTELAFWLSCSIFLFFSAESVRSDFLAMCVHHAATVILIAFSYLYSYWRLGIVILVIHDIVDVFLYVTKALYYSTWHSKAVEVGFALFALSYLLARLILFPIYCVWPTLNIWELRFITRGRVQTHLEVPGGIVLPLVLVVLLVLHGFWFRLIMKMIINAIRKPNRTGVSGDGDIRSDSEDEPQDINERIIRKKRRD
eukprot:GHVS01059996.1.p1 GENE.GHVS01059996.1~~GHVS01059996.1.p1  ORF type:complete len:355 (+),score=26.94 GHVS01059996.1:105-1169(+)